MSLLGRFRRKKEDPEVARRRLLLQAGRLGEATVLETNADEDGTVMLFYNYSIAGVDYETSQRLDEQQLLRRHDYLPGARVPMRYDPRRPANSFVV
ncbi:MAG TPA: hypothetical protein VFD75_17690 [Pyrinomonadaceae bacterium]|jgi:hypothetical protein|nr:hypothetical protein [Pyrinomonadaceae bacterium]